MQLPKIDPLKPIERHDLKPIGTDSVSKKPTLQEWHAAGGGIPLQYKGREHVWHAKVKKFAEGGDVQMAGGGDPLDEFSPPRYRSAGRRPESQNDRRAAANMPIDFARGVASGVLGAPGDIESLVRMLPGLDERTVLPTSEDIEKRIPLRSDTPAGRAASGLGTLAGGFYMGPGAPIRLVGGLPQAVYKAGKDFGRAAGQPAANVVKPTGGNFLTGMTEKDLKRLKARGPTHRDEALMMGGRFAQMADDPENVRIMAQDAALNKWVDSNLTNYVKKQMGTPDDPVRKLAEEGITHKPGLLEDYPRNTEDLKNQREAAGFPEEGMGQSPMAQSWERASDESLASHRAGDIQGMPEKQAKFQEAEQNMLAAKSELDKKFTRKMAEEYGLNEKELASMARLTSFPEKARMAGDADFAKANAEYLSHHSPMMESYMTLGRENPWISKVDPETRVYRPFTGDLGFDHIMDVLREDLTAGRIRPEQMNKISITDAVRRTHQYDQEMAAKMNASRAAAREGLPTYKEYPEGYKWIELNKPGAFAQESEAMGHSVRGYEPPKGHADWAEGSGTSGSSSYGHGGWEGIKSGNAKVYSLVDSKGAPHATVEVGQRPLNTWDDVTAAVGPVEAKKLWNEFDEIGGFGMSDVDSGFDLFIKQKGIKEPQKITQIKGKQNRAPNPEYLPYIQDFVKGGKWSDVGDLQNTGLRRTSDAFNETEQAFLRSKGVELKPYIEPEEAARYQEMFKRTPDAEPGFAAGGAAKKIVERAVKGVKKLLGAADEAPKGVEPIVVRTPEERAVIDKFGQKQEQEAVRQKKVEKAEKAAKESAGQSPEAQAKPAKTKGPRVKSKPDVYRKMAEEQGDEAVLKAARAGQHLKPTDSGYVGAPRTVTSGQGLGAMRRAMDTDFADSVEAVRLADPTRLGTWYDRAKQGIAESAEPYQLPRTLEQHGVYSAGVSPESELTFSLKHLNSRVAGEPGMAYRGAGMRNLDTAVAENRPANMGFKIGEYANKNDPRIPNEGLFGVNDFRRAQGMGYTDPQGRPWKAGVSDTMHPFMDAETALQVDRANTAGTGGRTDWAGPHIQEVPWVYGKGQDLHGRGLRGRYKGDELEGIKMALRDANNTARDYFYKHAASATHEQIPGASLGHVRQALDMTPEEKLAYGREGRFDMPAPEYALSDMGDVGAGNRDAIYGALGYRQLPSREAQGLYMNKLGGVETNPMTIARPLMDFPTGGGGGRMSDESSKMMDTAEQFRALMDAQEAGAYNLPNTMGSVKGKNSMVFDTRGRVDDPLADPSAGVLPTSEQLAKMGDVMGDYGFGVTATNRGAVAFPFDSSMDPKAASAAFRKTGKAMEEIFPSSQEKAITSTGYVPGVGKRSQEGPLSTAPFSGEATSDMLRAFSELNPTVAQNLSESESVRAAIRKKALRDAKMGGTRRDIQETRRFFSEADWPKAVEMIRKGMTPAAALAALGYSASSMAGDKR